MIQPGDEITIGYLHGDTDAVVVEVRPRGWLLVQTVGGRYDGLQYEAAAEFCVPRGEEPPKPFAGLF
jgi:hypothetical protein